MTRTGKNRVALNKGKIRRRTHNKQARSIVVAGVFQVLSFWRPTQHWADAGRQTHGLVQGLGYHGQSFSRSKGGNFFLQAQAKGGREQMPGKLVRSHNRRYTFLRTSNIHQHVSLLLFFSSLFKAYRFPTHAHHIDMNSMVVEAISYGLGFLVEVVFFSFPLRTP